MGEKARKIDIALVIVDNRLIAHVADCTAARKAAETGIPVMTMFGCERVALRDLPGNVTYHSCVPDLGAVR